jgi:hypothetical protein
MSNDIKRIPITTVKEISKRFSQDQVVLVTWDKANNRTHVVTYGRTTEDCAQAAQGGNFVKKALGWPDELCHAEPARIRNRRCAK